MDDHLPFPVTNSTNPHRVGRLEDGTTLANVQLAQFTLNRLVAQQVVLGPTQQTGRARVETCDEIERRLAS